MNQPNDTVDPNPKELRYARNAQVGLREAAAVFAEDDQINGCVLIATRADGSIRSYNTHAQGAVFSMIGGLEQMKHQLIVDYTD